MLLFTNEILSIFKRIYSLFLKLLSPRLLSCLECMQEANNSCKKRRENTRKRVGFSQVFNAYQRQNFGRKYRFKAEMNTPSHSFQKPVLLTRNKIRLLSVITVLTGEIFLAFYYNLLYIVDRLITNRVDFLSKCPHIR